MATGRANRVTGQVGECLVCAEIGRRLGLVATPLAGNVPDFDLVVADNAGKTAFLQVKAVNQGDWQSDVSRWIEVRKDENRKTQRLGKLKPLGIRGVVWVFVWLSKDRTKRPDRFFICSEHLVRKTLVREYRRFLSRHGNRRPKKWDSTHSALKIEHLQQHENKWARVMTALH